jgi:hypothetical protein
MAASTVQASHSGVQSVVLNPGRAAAGVGADQPSGDECNFFYSVTNPLCRRGFCDLALSRFAFQYPAAMQMIQRLVLDNFRYAGDTNSDSKANTDPIKKRIRINQTLSLKIAQLSLIYEMVNASNRAKFQQVFNRFFSIRHPTEAQARGYAQAILTIEAEAAYWRSRAAIDLNCENLIQNPRYNEIVKRSNDPERAIQEIAREMILHGKVRCGAAQAVDHYADQYFREWIRRDRERYPLLLMAPA